MTGEPSLSTTSRTRAYVAVRPTGAVDVTAQTLEANDLACGSCGATTDACLSMRDDCCRGCTHYPEPDTTAIDEAAVIRAADGDVSVPLNSDEVLATIRAFVRRGLTDDDIADRLGGGISGGSIYGYRVTGRTPRPRPAGGWTMTTPENVTSTTDALLVRAERHTSKRVQSAAQRAQDAIQRVRDLLAEDDGKRAQRERVERLERELREAKAALRGGPVAAQTPRGGPPRTFGDGDHKCRKGCGKSSPNPQGRAAHERFCTHVAEAS